MTRRGASSRCRHAQSGITSVAGIHVGSRSSRSLDGTGCREDTGHSSRASTTLAQLSPALAESHNAGHEEDDGVPKALEGKDSGGGDVVLEGGLARYPTVDTIHAARDPGDEDTESEEEAGAEVRSLDGVLNDKLAQGVLGSLEELADLSGWGRRLGRRWQRSFGSSDGRSVLTAMDRSSDIVAEALATVTVVIVIATGASVKGYGRRVCSSRFDGELRVRRGGSRGIGVDDLDLGDNGAVEAVLGYAGELDL